MNIHGVVDHVGLVEKLDLPFKDLFVGVKLMLLKEFEQRED